RVHGEEMAEASGSLKRPPTPTFKPEWEDLFFCETEGVRPIYWGTTHSSYKPTQGNACVKP
ncbi:hypothetical protein L9F63_010930, partial [Diploptera punctata]